MLRQYPIKLYTTYKNQFPKMSFVQFDSKSSRIQFELFDDIDVPMTDVVSAAATIQRPNGEERTYGMTVSTEENGETVSVPVFEIEGNLVTFILPVSALYVTDKHQCAVSFYASGYKRLTTPTFTYEVTEQLVDDIPTDEPYQYPVLTSLIEETKTVKADVDKAVLDVNTLKGTMEATNGELLSLQTELQEAEYVRQAVYDGGEVLVDVASIKVLNYPKLQTKYLSSFYKKLNQKTNITVVCHGDSLTYGQDTVSADRRAADTTLTDNGTAHILERAAKTYPEALQENLRSIYGNLSTVINKGYSGDWVELSMTHWNKNSNADLALVMLGTNDSNLGSTDVPSAVRGAIDKYVADMRSLIERYLDWGTAVILLTSPRLREPENLSSTTSFVTESYRNALVQLGKEYNVPVVDAESFMNGCDYTYYSDTIHPNGKGYILFAARLTSILIGMIHSIPRIKSGDTLDVRPTRDNILRNGAWFETSLSSLGSEEGADGTGLLATIPQNGWIHYSFIADEEDLILIPVYSVASGTFKCELDFGWEQGSYNLLSAVNKGTPQGTKPPSVITGNTATNNADIYNGNINITTTSKYLQITQKGLHNIKISNIGGSGSYVYFVGFVVMSHKDFLAQNTLNNPPVTNPVLHKLLYPYWTGSPAAVTSLDLTASDMNKYFAGNMLSSNEDYRSIPLKVVLTNARTNIIEYGFMWHDNTTGTAPTAGFYSWSIKQTDLIASPSNYRTITSITYDSTNRKYIVNFGGNTSQLGNVVVQVI